MANTKLINKIANHIFQSEIAKFKKRYDNDIRNGKFEGDLFAYAHHVCCTKTGFYRTVVLSVANNYLDGEYESFSDYVDALVAESANRINDETEET